MGPLDRLVADARKKITEFGVMVTYVGGGPEAVPFSYTAGLTAVGEPELMLLGSIAPGNAQTILNNLAFRVLKDEVRYRPGDVPPNVLARGYDVMMCGPTPALWLPRNHLPSIAMRIYGADAVSVYQVVYQDTEHRYPWQDGYDMPGQPYLRGGRG